MDWEREVRREYEYERDRLTSDEKVNVKYILIAIGLFAIIAVGVFLIV